MKCCDITPGMLRTQYQIEALTTTAIGGGATARTFAIVGSPSRCSFRFLSGRELMYADRLDAQTKAEALIRYRSDLTERHTLVIDGRRYQIRFIDNVEQRNRWLRVHLDGGVAL
jgi:head-tail adaptor